MDNNAGNDLLNLMGKLTEDQELVLMIVPFVVAATAMFLELILTWRKNNFYQPVISKRKFDIEYSLKDILGIQFKETTCLFLHLESLAGKLYFRGKKSPSGTGMFYLGYIQFHEWGENTKANIVFKIPFFKIVFYLVCIGISVFIFLNEHYILRVFVLLAVWLEIREYKSKIELYQSEILGTIKNEIGAKQEEQKIKL